MVFNTAAALVPQDTDTRSDAYERVGGELHLLSLGPDGGNGDSTRSRAAPRAMRPMSSSRRPSG